MKPIRALAITSVLVSVSFAVLVVLWLDEDPDVYLAALGGKSSDQVALASFPSTCGIEGDSTAAEGVEKSLLSSFLEANGPDAKINDLSKLSPWFSIANSRQLRALGSKELGYWVAGEEKQRIVGLSNIGYSSARDEALVCIQTRGVTDLVLMRKSEKGWVHAGIVWSRVS